MEGTTTVTRRGRLVEMNVADTSGELLRLAEVGAPVLVRGELEGAREDESGVLLVHEVCAAAVGLRGADQQFLQGLVLTDKQLASTRIASQCRSQG